MSASQQRLGHVAVLARVIDGLLDERLRRALAARVGERRPCTSYIDRGKQLPIVGNDLRQRGARRIDELLAVALRRTQAPILSCMFHQHGSRQRCVEWS